MLEREKFGDDELLREGLEEAASKGIVKLRLVDSLNSGYNEVLIDDGVLVIQVRFASESLKFIALTTSRLLLRSGEQTFTTPAKSSPIFYNIPYYGSIIWDCHTFSVYLDETGQ